MADPDDAQVGTRPARRSIVARIEREAGVPDLASVLADRLTPTDLQSLLLEVYARRVERRSVPDLVEEYAMNRFTRPAATSAAELVRWDSVAWAALPKEFVSVELAPVAPLGTTSLLASLSQDWSLSTSRNTEVVSDCTNVLAVEAAARRRGVPPPGGSVGGPVHLAASHRLLRGQSFTEGPGVHQHFRVFALVSAARDPGNWDFEIDATRRHLGFYVDALRRYCGDSVPLRVAVSTFGPAARSPGLDERLVTGLSGMRPEVDVGREESTPGGRAYYRSLRFHLYAMHPEGGEKELVDGGDVVWGQKLLNNAKERMFISGIGSERLVEFFGPLGRGKRSEPER